MPHRDPLARRACAHAWYVAHREERKVRDAAYRVAHRAEIAVYYASWRRENREKMRAYNRAYHKAYRAANREKVLQYWRAYAVRHRAEMKAYSAAYHRRNPEVASTSRARRRALHLCAVGSHTTQEWRHKVALLGGCCIYCGRSDAPLVRDHKVPLSRGGSDDMANIVPACRSCNARKHTKTDREFLGLPIGAT